MTDQRHLPSSHLEQIVAQLQRFTGTERQLEETIATLERQVSTLTRENDRLERENQSLKEERARVERGEDIIVLVHGKPFDLAARRVEGSVVAADPALAPTALLPDPHAISRPGLLDGSLIMWRETGDLGNKAPDAPPHAALG